MRLTTRYSLAMVLAAALLTPAGFASALGPLEPPVPVYEDEDARARQESAAVAAAGGQTVAVWIHQVDGLEQVRARRFDVAGAPAGEPFLVQSLRIGKVRGPAVAVAPDGSFAVAWAEEDLTGRSKVMGRRYGPAGEAGGVFPVSSSPEHSYANPSLALQPDGALIAVYGRRNSVGSGEVMLRRFGPDGAPPSTESFANHYTVNDEMNPDIAAAADGSFVVVWESHDFVNPARNIFARRFSAAGAPLERDARVNETVGTGWHENPSVVVRGDGSFAVVWTTFAPGFENSDISMRRYASGGAAAGGESRVNLSLPGFQQNPEAALDAAGNLAVVWQNDYVVAPLYARYYGDQSGGGLSIPEQFALEEPEIMGNSPVVVLPAEGRILALWTREADRRTTLQARRFLANLPPTISSLSDLSLAPGASATVSFSVADHERPASQLVVSVATSDQTLLPSAGARLQGAGADRTLTLTAAPDAAGLATVMVSVSDGAQTTATTFSVSIANEGGGSPQHRVHLPLVRR